MRGVGVEETIEEDGGVRVWGGDGEAYWQEMVCIGVIRSGTRQGVEIWVVKLGEVWCVHSCRR